MNVLGRRGRRARGVATPQVRDKRTRGRSADATPCTFSLFLGASKRYAPDPARRAVNLHRVQAMIFSATLPVSVARPAFFQRRSSKAQTSSCRRHLAVYASKDDSVFLSSESAFPWRSLLALVCLVSARRTALRVFFAFCGERDGRMAPCAHLSSTFTLIVRWTFCRGHGSGST